MQYPKMISLRELGTNQQMMSWLKNL